jgi:anaerobic selenocysteine-containing dehydrogenase
MTDISRRKFIQLTVMGSAVAAAGCDTHNRTRYQPGLYLSEVTGTYGGYDNRVWPYENMPDGMETGVPQYFATACKACPAGCGLYVRTMGGRALQVQGNPGHPVSAGHVCSRGIGSLQHLYNPDRIRFPKTRSVRTASFSEPGWAAALAQTVQGLQSSIGHVAVLADAVTIGQSPTLSRVAAEFAKSVGGTLTTYSLLDDSPWRAASQAVYGKNQIPAYHLDEADVIVSFGGDFLEAWPSPVLYNRQFGDFRQGPRRTGGARGTFIYVGPRMSMTAANADVWLPCNPGTEAAVAAALNGGSVAQAAQVSGLTEQQIANLASTFNGAGTRAVAVAGNGLLSAPDATAAFTTVESLNASVKSQCVGFGTPLIDANKTPTESKNGYKGIQALIQAMNAGQVGALVILGYANPVFTLPAADGMAQALAKVPFIAALTPFEDETSVLANVQLPTRHFLEEWGDSEPLVVPAGASLATLQQPIVDPQYIGGQGDATDHTVEFVPWMDTRPTIDVLAQIAQGLGKPLADADDRAAVRRTWAKLGQADLAQKDLNNDRKWINAVASGGLWTQGAMTPAKGQAAVTPPAAPSSPIQDGKYALHLYPHIYWTDGRGANIPWHQEVADPMTSSVYNSGVEINLQEAMQKNIRTGDIVRLTSAHGSIDALAVPSPGINPGAVALPIGQGHTAFGRYANSYGVNALAILDPTADPRTGALAYSATRVTLEKVASAESGYNGPQTLVLTQDMPGGVEPEEVMKLIHDTAKEYKNDKPTPRH